MYRQLYHTHVKMACPLRVVDKDTRLLLQAGMYDLTLIDHGAGPTDKIKRLMMAPGVFERALIEIIGNRPDLSALPPGNFSYVNPQLYAEQIETYRYNLPRDQTYITLMGADLGVLGGHFAAYYITSSTVFVHDSMTTAQGPGPYASFFMKIALELFPQRAVQLERVGPGEQSLQSTGGFTWLPPSFMRGQVISDPTVAHLIQNSNCESQDHFCWSWCLFYLHSRVLQQSLVPLRRELLSTGIAQVAVIKMYTWLLLTWLQLDHDFPDELRDDYFAIWDSYERLQPETYRRYHLGFSHPVQLQTVDDCFVTAYQLENLVLTRIEERSATPESCLLEK